MSFNKMISDTSIRLGPVRFSYVNVFAPRRNPDGTPGKYGVCVIFPKTDKEAYNIFEEAYKNAAALGKTTKWNGRVPAKVSLPLHDGDDERPDDPAFKGMWYFNCSSNNKPGVRVREAGMVVEALDETEFYSGVYGAVTINLFPYSTSGNVGVGVGLNNVIATEAGERLGGGRSADADFKDLAD
jgi:hypothetical protein